MGCSVVLGVLAPALAARRHRGREGGSTTCAAYNRSTEAARTQGLRRGSCSSPAPAPLPPPLLWVQVRQALDWTQRNASAFESQAAQLNAAAATKQAEVEAKRRTQAGV